MNKIMMTACAAILAAQGAALADGAALVIGNSDYKHAPRAVAAETDANAVAAALEASGYDVTLGIDLTRVEMRAAMDQFARSAQGEEQVVIFYSGHAMRMAGRTFLSPVDFNPVGPVAVAFDGASFEVLQSLAGDADSAVVFIDGAQLDGFGASGFAEPGLAPISAEAGAAVISAAAPGWAIRRSGEGQSNFGRAIVENFLSPGTSFAEAVEASGTAIWTTGSVPDLTIVAAPEVAEAADASNPAVELAFWRSTESGGERADYEAYLAAYPDGIFAAIARNRLGETDSSSTPPPSPEPEVDPAQAAETALNLTRGLRYQIQRDLTTLGYDTRGVDGVFGRGTRGALRSWQESEGLAATGFVTSDQIERLHSDAEAETARVAKEAAAAAAMTAEQAKLQEDRYWTRTEEIGTIAAYQRYVARYPEGRYLGKAKSILNRAKIETDKRDWEEAKRLHTASAYNRYLDLHPDGKFVDIAQRRYQSLQGAASSGNDLTAWRQAKSQNTAKAYRDFVRAYPTSRYAGEAENRALKLLQEGRARREDRLNLSGRDWQSLEKRLDFLGFRVGRVDGRVDNDLRKAIFSYRRSRGLVEHGYVDQAFIDALVGETSGASPTGQLLNKLFKKLSE